MWKFQALCHAPRGDGLSPKVGGAVEGMNQDHEQRKRKQGEHIHSFYVWCEASESQVGVSIGKDLWVVV